MTLPPLDYETPKESKGDGLGVVALLLLLIGGCILVMVGKDLAEDYVSGARGVISRLGLVVRTRPGNPLSFNVVCIVLAGVMMLGAVQMLSRRWYWLAMVGAILALLPVSTCWFGFMTMPLGIWALVVLRRPEVRETFRR